MQKEEGAAEWIRLPCLRSGVSPSRWCYFVAGKGNRSGNELCEHLLRCLIFLEDPYRSTTK